MEERWQYKSNELFANGIQTDNRLQQKNKRRHPPPLNRQHLIHVKPSPNKNPLKIRSPDNVIQKNPR